MKFATLVAMPMQSCPICHSEVSPKMRFCIECGAPIPPEATQAVEPTVVTPTPEPISATLPPPAAAAHTSLHELHQDTPRAAAAATPAHPIPAPAPVVDSPQFLGADASDDASETIRCFVHFPHVPVTGHGSLLRLAFENTSAVPLERVLVRAESRGLTSAAERQIARIAPGATVQIPLEIEPGRAGQHELRFEVQLVQSGQRLAYLGSRSWHVLEVPDTSNLVVNISELQKINGASNAGLGSEFGSIQIGNLLGDHAPKTLNDLLSTELPTEFQRVHLELDYSVSVAAQTVFAARHAASLTLPRQFVGAVQAGTLATLTPTASGTAALSLRLTARHEIKLGRSRAECDVVTWLLPRNEANDERTRHVSKVQATARISADGIHLFDTGSANGTRADGVSVGTDDPGLPLGERASLQLAGQYELELVTHPTGFPGGPEISGLRLWPGPAQHAPILRGGVQFYPGNSDTMVHECAWVFTDVPFGSSRASALVVPAEGVAELQGRFHHFRGCFWVENSSSEGSVSVNGQALQVGNIVPLVSGQIVTLGRTDYRVEIAP